MIQGFILRRIIIAAVLLTGTALGIRYMRKDRTVVKKNIRKDKAPLPNPDKIKNNDTKVIAKVRRDSKDSKIKLDESPQEVSDSGPALDQAKVIDEAKKEDELVKSHD